MNLPRPDQAAGHVPVRGLVTLLAALLVLSGMCALVYQVLWLRLLSLTFGVTTHAASTVLASYMAGLALGSFVAGRVADRVARPLRLFGFIELSIGICALASPLALAAVHQVYLSIFGHLPDSLALATLLRFVLAFGVLIVPTALMGATMPIVIKSSLATLDSVGARVSTLYASNTAGAIAGTIAAGFYLIPQLGLRGSFLLAASINAAVGLAAIAASSRVERSLARSPAAPAGPAPSRVAIPASARLVLGVFAISGFASLALEVIWFRVLAMFIGTTSYAFTVMLAAVLAGIALGSALVAPLMRWRRLDWLQVLAFMQIGAALMAVRSFSSLRRPVRLPDWWQPLVDWPGVGHAVPLAVSSAVAVLPTAIFLGLAFPIGIRILTAASDAEGHTAERIGLFYCVNLCGAIVGAVAGGFLLLPTLGSRGSLIAMAAAFLLSGLAIQLWIARRQPAFTVLAALASILFVSEAGQAADPRDIAQRRIHGGEATLWQEEGIQSTVAVVGGAGGRVLYLDGRHQANDSPGMVFIHRRIGLLGAVLHPRPERALVVGLGGGATSGALSQYPGLQVDVVELSSGIMRAAAFFSHVNFDVLRQPNVRGLLDDGRNYLQRAPMPYDVITADLIPPHLAGAATINSFEYFRLVRESLAKGGVALHWNGGSTDAQYRLILRAFAAAFPHVSLWGDGTLMVGTTEPIRVSQQRIEAMLTEPATRDMLKLMHVERFDHLVRMFRASAENVRVYLGDGPMLTDDKPSIEYFASLSPADRDLSKLARDATGVFQP